ncbi:histone acetyltransferase type B catalytic subunit [Eurosta solidaginis]|uniref:histone acetyltransferase type B catalytic subunit n=1 Tax=Eurosta solidaginis TaxID=178769 RepID=UPI003531124D
MADIHEYDELVLDAVEAVEFKLIRRKQDLDDDSLVFHPMMAHQIFGESERIFGYKGLCVRILYTAGPLHIYIGIEYDSRVDELSGGDIKADDVVRTIAEKLPDGCFFVNMDEFLKTLDKADKFKPYGEKITEHSVTDEDGQEHFFELYHCDYKVPAFLKFFSRLQTFILWFVDAASYIDVDDPQWSFFVCYEKYKNDNGDYQYATTGYTTVYEYYAYPQHIRPRISQVLVLPPFQKLGIGTKFIETVYKYYQSLKNVIDMTVEDPSDDFQRLRNYIDARLCMELKSFGGDVIKKGFNKEMVREARETYKLNPRQCRRVYEILRLYYTNIYDKDDYHAYRLDVKRRLNAIYYKQINDIKKMEKAKVDTEWLRARLPTPSQRMEQLHEEYEQVENAYKQIVEKLRD